MTYRSCRDRRKGDTNDTGAIIYRTGAAVMGEKFRFR